MSNRRTTKELTPEAKVRMKGYVYANADVPSKDLADDLYLTTQTVAAFKAWNTGLLKYKKTS